MVVLLTLLPSASVAAPGLSRPYLALFTFQNAEMSALTDEQLRILEASPFDGMATWCKGYRSTDPPPSLDGLRPRMDYLRKHTTKHLWPVVFLTRMIEQTPDSKRADEGGPDPEFAKIRGLDLDDEAGALTGFLLNWRRALQIARELGTPGMCLDPEFYNAYGLEGVGTLAKRRGEPEGETLEKLHALGARMADIVEEEYPDAVVWCLFTRLCGRSGSITGVPGHILQAFLDRAKERGLALKLVDGAEEGDSVGYVNPSVTALEQKVTDYVERYKPLTERYHQLVLGGTIAPWLDGDHRATWMKGAPTVETIEGFEPYFTLLLQRLDFVWVYAAGNAYNVWQEPYAERFPPVLEAAKEGARELRAGKE